MGRLVARKASRLTAVRIFLFVALSVTSALSLTTLGMPNAAAAEPHDLHAKITWFAQAGTGESALIELDDAGRCTVPSFGLVPGAKVIRIYPYAKNADGLWEYPIEGTPVAWGTVLAPGKPRFSDDGVHPRDCTLRLAAKNVRGGVAILGPEGDLTLNEDQRTYKPKELRKRNWDIGPLNLETESLA